MSGYKRRQDNLRLAKETKNINRSGSDVSRAELKRSGFFLLLRLIDSLRMLLTDTTKK